MVKRRAGLYPAVSEGVMPDQGTGATQDYTLQAKERDGDGDTKSRYRETWSTLGPGFLDRSLSSFFQANPPPLCTHGDFMSFPSLSL